MRAQMGECHQKTHFRTHGRLELTLVVNTAMYSPVTILLCDIVLVFPLLLK